MAKAMVVRRSTEEVEGLVKKALQQNGPMGFTALCQAVGWKGTGAITRLVERGVIVRVGKPRSLESKYVLPNQVPPPVPRVTEVIPVRVTNNKVKEPWEFSVLHVLNSGDLLLIDLNTNKLWVAAPATIKLEAHDA